MLFSQTYKVYISHTDAGGIVYHANHLTFFEHCRRDWLTSLGFDAYFLADGTHFVVANAELSYKQALLLDDVLVVSIDKIISKPASLIVKQSIYRNKDDVNTGKVATQASITLACVRHTDTGIRPTRPPKALSEMFAKLSQA